MNKKKYTLSCFEEAVDRGNAEAMTNLRNTESFNDFDFCWDFAFDALVAMGED